MPTANSGATASGNTARSLDGGDKVCLCKARDNLLSEKWLPWSLRPAPTTHRCGNGLFSHDLQRVDHRDVAKPPGNGQGSVSILARGSVDGELTSHSRHLSAWVFPHASTYTNAQVSVSSAPSHCHRQITVSSQTLHETHLTCSYSYSRVWAATDSKRCLMS